MRKEHRVLKYRGIMSNIYRLCHHDECNRQYAYISSWIHLRFLLCHLVVIAGCPNTVRCPVFDLCVSLSVISCNRSSSICSNVMIEGLDSQGRSMLQFPFFYTNFEFDYAPPNQIQKLCLPDARPIIGSNSNESSISLYITWTTTSATAALIFNSDYAPK